jgi:hypothetical protein
MTIGTITPIPPARLEYLVRRIWPLGERTLLELIGETLRDPDGDLAARPERYAAIDPVALRVTGGDQLVPQIFAVGSAK